ncbi:MAG: hypothetical protein GX644_14850 [Limnobacter sp.]|nr:hypothetical protein [Limnobacter sp.]
MKLADPRFVFAPLAIAAALSVEPSAAAQGDRAVPDVLADHDAELIDTAAIDIAATDAAETDAAAPAPDATAPSDASSFADAMTAVKQTFANIYREGAWDVYVSGRAWHGNHSYSEREREQFNEHAWGLGIGKTLRDSRGNEQSLFAFGLKDSNSRPQWMAGYLRQWTWPAAGSGVEFGLGYSAMLMSRKDVFDRVPFPMAVPIASLGTRRVKLMMTWVPPFARKGIGDVVLVFGRISFD